MLQPTESFGNFSQQEEAGCLGKASFPSESSARAALKFLERSRTLRSGDGMGVYKCRFCPDWHFGH